MVRKLSLICAVAGALLFPITTFAGEGDNHHHQNDQDQRHSNATIMTKIIGAITTMTVMTMSIITITIMGTLGTGTMGVIGYGIGPCWRRLPLASLGLRLLSRSKASTAQVKGVQSVGTDRTPKRVSFAPAPGGKTGANRPHLRQTGGTTDENDVGCDQIASCPTSPFLDPNQVLALPELLRKRPMRRDANRPRQPSIIKRHPADRHHHQDERRHGEGPRRLSRAS